MINANNFPIIESLAQYQELMMQLPSTQRIIFLDTETTGISPTQGDKMVEIACLEMIGRECTGQHYFHTYLNPKTKVAEGAFRVHGLSNEFLNDKPIFSQKITELLAFVKDSIVIIHNASFDLGFLDAELQANKHKPFKTYCLGVIDSLKVARYEYTGKKNSLDALCDRFNISREHRQFHGALLDTNLLAQTWLAMSRGQDELFASTTKIKQNETQAIEFNVSNDILTRLQQKPNYGLTEAEKLAHESYMLNTLKIL